MSPAHDVELVATTELVGLVLGVRVVEFHEAYLTSVTIILLEGAVNLRIVDPQLGIECETNLIHE
jgi:hypothetical protein